ncbi:MAG: hypothetical protein P1S60_07285 [Anaerolineae bacterium]|nr:hypothetical protein [Anaerolineae bacterium]
MARNYDIYARRVSASGTVLSWFAVAPHTPQHPYPNNRLAPSVAYDPVNDRYLIVWLYDTAGDGSNWDVHGTFANWDGPIPGLQHFIICDWSTTQDFPDVAYSPVTKEFMIVWMTQHPSVPAYISGRRMTAATGAFPSGGDFTISHVSEARVRPEIAYNSWHNEYLVVYDNTKDILATRYTGNGNPITPIVPLTSGSVEFGIAGWLGDETQPSVDYCRYSDQYLVAWQNPQPDIYARFVNADSTMDGGPLHLDYTSVYETEPQVACSATGDSFLVVWQQQFSSLTGPYGIWGQFVSIHKTLGASIGIMVPTSGVNAYFTQPVIAGGQTNFLTVWEHDRAGTTFQDIHGRLISPFTVYVPLAMRNH